MRNGIIDSFEMNGIASSLDKIIKLRRKYDFKKNILFITPNISIEFCNLFKTCYILVNETRAIKYIYGNIRAMAKSVATAATFGIIKTNIRFVTTDKTIANHSFIKSLSNTLKNSIPQIENDMKNTSKERWNI